MQKIYRYVLRVAYDGRKSNGWHGSKVLSGRFFIQNKLETILYKILRENIKLYCAGRTDRGVHAKQQVCHFDTGKFISTINLRNAINFYLKPYIFVHNVRIESSKFHVRFSAKQRIYKYYLSEKPIPQFQGITTHIRYLINWNIVKRGIDEILKFPNMNCFILPRLKGIRRNRHLDFMKLSHTYIFSEKIYILTLGARSFTHHQVRIMTGALLSLGREFISLTDFIKAGMNGIYHSSFHVISPNGLYLHQVKY